MPAELGTTNDPTALVPGDASALGGVVWWLQYYGDTLRDAGDGLSRIDTADGWSGPAADAFRSVFSNQPGRWVDAGDAFHAAATGFDRYTATLTTAQQQAAHAIQWWNQGQAETDAAQAQYDQQVRDSPVPIPFEDPGQAQRNSAQSLLAQARDAVRRAGDSAAATLDEATQMAPAKPGFWSQVGGVLDVVGDGLEHMGDDVLNGLASVGNAAIHHPGDIAMMAAGLGLTVLSVGGEIGGVALDATGVGAVVGVPANVVSAAGIVTGASMMMAGAADLGSHATGDDAVSPASSGDDAPPDVSNGPGPRSSSDEGQIARRFGASRKAVDQAIHVVKKELGGSGRSGNPDVIVDLDTGEVYVKLPNGKASSDSIGNILDELPGE
jgi:hypothetical protein